VGLNRVDPQVPLDQKGATDPDAKGDGLSPPSNGRGEGEAQIVFVEYDTGRPCGASRPQKYRFGADPRRVYGSFVTITDCKFPRPGYYLLEFRYNGVILAEQLLLVEE
jgi:hypothetical protein